MSDDELMSEEEEEEEEEPPRRAAPAAKPSHGNVDHLDEASKELLETNSVEFDKLEAEILELRERTIKRKKEREVEEKLVRKQRDEEEKRRLEEEKDRKRKKEEEEQERKMARAQKMAEFEKMKNPTTPNFVISKKKVEEDKPKESDDKDDAKEKISREQANAEKAAILANRIKSYDMSETDGAKLLEMAKAIHKDIFRGEGEKYDLEKRFKEQQVDMMELAEKARSMNKVGKAGAIKRIQLGPDEVDKIQERFAGAPSKIIMYSPFERQKDKREYGERKVIFKGPQYADPIPRIGPNKKVIWDENTGLPIYTSMDYKDPKKAEKTKRTKKKSSVSAPPLNALNVPDESASQKPSEEAISEETVPDEPTQEDTPAEEDTAEEAPAEEAPAEEATAAEETPAEEPPAEETAVEEAAAEEEE